MFDAIKLLGSLAQNNTAPSAGSRFGAAASQGSGGPLEQLLSQFGGGGALASQPGAQSGLGGMLGGLAEMAKRAAASPQQEVRNNNPAAVGGLGALAGALLGGGHGALGGGLMAVLGSLAVSALQSHGGSAAAATPAYAPATSADAQRKATVIIRAMIQAAKADGQIDQQEMQRIMGKLGEGGQDDAARAFVQSEMGRPIDIPGLVQDVGSPQEAAEVYAASLMAIEVDTQSERDYLMDLANALRLPPAATAQINSSLGVRI